MAEVVGCGENFLPRTTGKFMKAVGYNMHLILGAEQPRGCLFYDRQIL
jgi:hypothetical protein